MIQFFQDIANKLQGLWEIVCGTFEFLKQLLIIIPELAGILTTLLITLPAIITVVATICIAIHIIKVVLYGG